MTEESKTPSGPFGVGFSLGYCNGVLDTCLALWEAGDNTRVGLVSVMTRWMERGHAQVQRAAFEACLATLDSRLTELDDAREYADVAWTAEAGKINRLLRQQLTKTKADALTRLLVDNGATIR